MGSAEQHWTVPTSLMVFLAKERYNCWSAWAFWHHCAYPNSSEMQYPQKPSVLASLEHWVLGAFKNLAASSQSITGAESIGKIAPFLGHSLDAGVLSTWPLEHWVFNESYWGELVVSCLLSEIGVYAGLGGETAYPRGGVEGAAGRGELKMARLLHFHEFA